MIYILLGLSCFFFLWRFRLSRKPFVEPPELSGKLPLIGHGHWFFGDGTAMFRNVVAKISEEIHEKGGVIKTYLGPVDFYGVADPDDSLKIGNNCLRKHYIYDFMKPFTANGLLNADVATWKMHRKLLNPAFSQYVLDGFIEMFNTQAQRLVDEFAKELEKPFNHDAILRKNNLETICASASAIDTEEFRNLQNQTLPHFEDILQIFNQRLRTFWLHSDCIFNLTSLKKRLDHSIKIVNGLTTSIIKKKKFETSAYSNSETKSNKCKSFLDLILELIETNSSLTEEQILGETNTFIAAGHDTTASALTFALTLLGSHAEVQEKAFEEIYQVLGNSNTNVGKEVLSKLIYLEAVIKETVRLYPSVPIIARQLETNIQLKNYTLKANTGCAILIYGVNRHNIWGPDANTFRPGRWFESETLPDPKYYAAFGVGRRSCIGKVYAMMSMKIILAKVLLKYRISSDASKLVIKMETTLKPASGHFISLEQRKI